MNPTASLLCKVWTLSESVRQMFFVLSLLKLWRNVVKPTFWSWWRTHAVAFSGLSLRGLKCQFSTCCTSRTIRLVCMGLRDRNSLVCVPIWKRFVQFRPYVMAGMNSNHGELSKQVQSVPLLHPWRCIIPKLCARQS